MKKLLLLKLLLFFYFTSTAQCFESYTFGGMHTLGQKPDGTLWGWGAAAYGNLETITIVEPNPIPVGTETDWKVVVAGQLNTFAIKTDGTLWGTGSNQYGSLGVNSSTQKFYSFQQIGTASNWVDVYPNTDFTLALKDDGTLWAWGRNNYNQIGNAPANADQLFPVQVGSDTDWIAAAGYLRTSFGLKSNGTIWGWGYNISSLIETGGGVNTVATPTQIGSANDWVKMSVGPQHILAQKTDGTLWSWGGGAGLGVGGAPTETNTPQKISNDKWIYFSAGGDTSFGIKEDGTLWSWGDNFLGRLGDGTTTDRLVPYQIGSDNNWKTVDAGFAAAVMATKTDGSVWYWGGKNQYGEYGNGESFGTTLNLTPAMTEGICMNLGELDLENNAVNNQVFNVYPNPAKEMITIQYESSTNGAVVNILDISGRVVSSNSLHKKTGKLFLSTDKYQQGVYIVVMKQINGEIWQKKLIVE